MSFQWTTWLAAMARTTCITPWLAFYTHSYCTCILLVSNSLGLLTLFLLRNEKTLANLQSKEPLIKKLAHVRGMTLTLNVTLPSLQYQGEQT